MLLPRALLDALLFLSALRMVVAPLLSVLLPIVLVLHLPLLGMLLLFVLVLWLLLLSVLLLLVLILPLLLLSMLLLGFGLLVLILLLLGVVLFIALLVLLCKSRGCDSQQQRKNRGAGDPDCIHACCLCSFQLLWACS
jgi:hypothetical protein